VAAHGQTDHAACIEIGVLMRDMQARIFLGGRKCAATDHEHRSGGELRSKYKAHG
jgi:hypothetical protein